MLLIRKCVFKPCLKLKKMLFGLCLIDISPCVVDTIRSVLLLDFAG